MTSNLGLCQKNHIFCIHIKQIKNLRMRCCFFSNWKKEINWKWNKSCQIQVFLFMINCYNVEHLILYQKVKNYAYWMAQGVVVSSDRVVYIKMWMIKLAMYKTIKWSHGVMNSIATAVFFSESPLQPPLPQRDPYNTTRLAESQAPHPRPVGSRSRALLRRSPSPQASPTPISTPISTSKWSTWTESTSTTLYSAYCSLILLNIQGFVFCQTVIKADRFLGDFR